MKTIKEIKREWLAWLIREELLPRYPDAVGDLPGGWRTLARETASYYERGEEVPYKHRKKVYAEQPFARRFHAHAAAQAAADATYDAADTADIAADAEADDDDAVAANAYCRMAIALIRIAELEPFPELDARILTVLASGSTLNMDFYHACDTIHCRAGFAVTIHPRGMELEKEFGPYLTGAAIYLVSTGAIPDFFASNEDAMASIREGAILRWQASKSMTIGKTKRPR